jgi:LysR family transcriptional regulator, mexEF-oprN operon transcriptional activator
MLSIDHYNLRSFDLNLFLAFDAMMLERNVTRAAKRLRVQQPAMSHSLSVLRVLFQDELFVRSGQRMEPTPYALELATPVRKILSQAQETLSFRVRFDPLSEKRTFRVALSAHLEAFVLPELLIDLKDAAPGVRLSVREATRRNIADLLDGGLAEIGAGYFDSKQNWIGGEKLFDETYVCCFNEELLKLKGCPTREQYFKLPHAMVSTKENPLGCLDRAFSAFEERPNVIVSVPHFFSAAEMASRTPLLTTLPNIVASRYASKFGLRICSLPIALGSFPVSMVWHSRLERDEGIRWLRDRLRSTVCKSFSGAQKASSKR